MKRYEYKVVSYFSTRLVGNVRPEQVEKELNSMAKQGWKVHTIVEFSEGVFTFIYERQLPSDIIWNSHRSFHRESIDPQYIRPISPFSSKKNPFCSHCGVQLLPGHRFCPRCGKKKIQK